MLAPGSGALSHFEFLSPGSWPLSGPGSTFRAAGRRSDGQRSTRSLAAGPRAVQGWHADGTLPLPPSQQPRVPVPTALRPQLLQTLSRLETHRFPFLSSRSLPTLTTSLLGRSRLISLYFIVPRPGTRQPGTAPTSQSR